MRCELGFSFPGSGLWVAGLWEDFRVSDGVCWKRARWTGPPHCSGPFPPSPPGYLKVGGLCPAIPPTPQPTIFYLGINPKNMEWFGNMPEVSGGNPGMAPEVSAPC